MRSGRVAHWTWVLPILAACALRVLWIGDVSFIFDAAKLLRHAQHLNSEGRWAINNGLPGVSSPVSHGPLSVWAYQVALRHAADPMEIALWKSGIVTALTVGSLYVLATLLDGSARSLLWFALLSPSLWEYSRDLWDNSWSIPLSLVAWTSYLKFNARPALGTLTLVLASFTGCFLTHLTSVPIVATLSIHLIWVRRSWLWKHCLAATAMMVVCIGAATPYLLYLWQTQAAAVQWPTHRFVERVLSGFGGILMFMPLTASGGEWYPYPGLPGLISVMLRMLGWFSLGAGVFFFTGVGVAVSNLRRSSGRRDEAIATADRLALAASVAYGVFAASAALRLDVQYVNALIPVALYFVWRGARFLAALSEEGPRRQTVVRIGRVLLIGWGVSLGVCLIALQWRIHHGHGTRDLTWGPTLSNQWEIAQDLARLPAKPQLSRPNQPAHFPDAFDVVSDSLDMLRTLVRPDQPSQSQALPPNAEVNYRRPSDPWDGEIVLRIAPEPAPDGAGP